MTAVDERIFGSKVANLDEIKVGSKIAGDAIVENGAWCFRMEIGDEEKAIYGLELRLR